MKVNSLPSVRLMNWRSEITDDIKRTLVLMPQHFCSTVKNCWKASKSARRGNLRRLHRECWCAVTFHRVNKVQREYKWLYEKKLVDELLSGSRDVSCIIPFWIFNLLRRKAEHRQQATVCIWKTGTCMRWLHFKSDGWSDTSRSEKYRDTEKCVENKLQDLKVGKAFLE